MAATCKTVGAGRKGCCELKATTGSPNPLLRSVERWAYEHSFLERVEHSYRLLCVGALCTVLLLFKGLLHVLSVRHLN